MTRDLISTSPIFSQLKGIDGKDIDGEINEMLRVLHLEDKKNARSTALSGGMKRKLSVGIALIGGSKVSFLISTVL